MSSQVALAPYWWPRPPEGGSERKHTQAIYVKSRVPWISLTSSHVARSHTVDLALLSADQSARKPGRYTRGHVKSLMASSLRFSSPLDTWLISPISSALSPIFVHLHPFYPLLLTLHSTILPIIPYTFFTCPPPPFASSSFPPSFFPYSPSPLLLSSSSF